MMKLLTLDRWGAANLDKWREKNGDELELGKNGDELELDEQEKWRREPSDTMYRRVFSPGWYNQPELKIPAEL